MNTEECQVLTKPNLQILVQDVGLLAKCGCIMCTTIVYQEIANILVCSILSKVSKFYFHTQFKSHNNQILNNKCLISTFSWRAAKVY
jgi:hypothetical protein